MSESNNFLRRYVSLFDNTEVPPRFANWCGISCISAVLERRIWVDMGIFTVYPNTFIVLVAESGRCRKSTAVVVTDKLLRKMDPGPRIVAEKVTPEKMISELRVVRTDDPSQLLKETCGGIVIADELMVFLNEDSYKRGLSGLLIKFYDCRDKFEYSTVARGREEVSYSHLSVLGASTFHALRESIPIKAMGDGLTSRILFVYEDQIPPPVPRPRFTMAQRQTEQDLVQILQGLTKLSGEIRLDGEAEEFYDSEYRRFATETKLYDDPQLHAYASRRDKHLLKLAMCLMVSEGVEDTSNLSISYRNLIGAKILLEDIEEHMPKVFDQIGKTEQGGMVEKVIWKIKQSGGFISRADLLKAFSNRIDSTELDKLVETLVRSEQIVRDSLEGKLGYRVINKQS